MRLAPYPAYIAIAGLVGLISVAHQAPLRRMRLAPYPAAYIAVAGLVGLISVAHQAHPSPDAASALSG
ncbi:hypothetical protein, partial [Citrobacter portucalensis]|uniref:hypothetical protein n=1 Tax=Citrobacter portucalensis TaxID=1639133 RepID=UPI003C2E457C